MTRSSKVNGESSYQILKQLKKIAEVPTDYSAVAFDLKAGFTNIPLIAAKENISQSTNFYILAPGIPTTGSNLDITFPLVYEKLSFASTSTEDNLTGTGLAVILVRGLDNDYMPIEDFVVLNGQSKVLSNIDFWRVNIIIGVQSGSGSTTKKNIGNIYCSSENGTFTNGVPQSVVYESIGIQRSISQSGKWTTRGQVQYIRANYSTTASINKPITLYIESTLGTSILRSVLSYITQSSSSFDVVLSGPISPNSDLMIRAQSDTVNTDLFAFFTLIQYNEEDNRKGRNPGFNE